MAFGLLSSSYTVFNLVNKREKILEFGYMCIVLHAIKLYFPKFEWQCIISAVVGRAVCQGSDNNL